MLTESELQFSDILKDISRALDIPPGKYKRAIDRAAAVRRHLESGHYHGSASLPDIYMQGSFELGTIVKPIKDGKEADYDVDIVCQLSIAKATTTPKAIKTMVGDRLNADADYKHMLDKEGRRCWTLEYPDEGGIGFHMDILPSIPMDDAGRQLLNERAVSDRYHKHAIDLTELDENSSAYLWKEGGSNPRGYAKWFADINSCSPDYIKLSESQRQDISKSTLNDNGQPIFASSRDVPNALVRTPLQRAIQILKRHRDFYFNDNPDHKPISMIITTLITRFYANEQNLLVTLNNTIQKISDFAQYNVTDLRCSENVMETQSILDYIGDHNPSIDKPIYKLNGKWYVPNPVNPAENFADRWDSEKAASFFGWIKKVKHDFELALEQKGGFLELSETLRPIFGQKAINDAFIINAERMKQGLSKKIMKTTPITGVLSSKGTIKNPQHNFYAN